MPDQAVRQQLDSLIQKSGEGYAEISRLLGRNAAYIQQYIKRGVPKRLGELERRILANHFRISESLLGGLSEPVSLRPDSTAHSLLEIGYLGSRAADILHLDSRLLPRPPGPGSAILAAHVVDGDSMAPTLLSGDHLLVDQSDAGPVRDGLYLIENDLHPAARRLAVNPVSRRISILSDNAAYPSYPDCDPGAVRVLGRIVWMSRPLN